ncbi:hypothetical protein PYCCODRAFT_1476463 [Trametes coccinea BRFM310]|uniref:Uncharacterized protein n=1 Tax=Trametes coccinea (strain BRFM310) TaxID=1353009 RepID=A0A1Y2IS14_TRAC3|nr:hypothetical protein PYCCODRAFT_1476463 [Trametes coccinea BRFM310]
MYKLTTVRNSLLHGHALPEDMPINAREFITHTLRDVETMEFGEGEDFSSSVHIQDRYHPRNLLDAFSIARTGLAVRHQEEPIVDKILRLATLSAYVACNLSEQEGDSPVETNQGEISIYDGLRGIRDCLGEIEVAAGLKKGTELHGEEQAESSAVQPRHASPPDVIPSAHHVVPIAPTYDVPNTIVMQSSPSTHVTPPRPHFSNSSGASLLPPTTQGPIVGSPPTPPPLPARSRYVSTFWASSVLPKAPGNTTRRSSGPLTRPHLGDEAGRVSTDHTSRKATARSGLSGSTARDSPAVSHARGIK